VAYAFNEALDELLEEGVANRIQRYKQASTRIRQRMKELGVKPFLPADHLSNTITCFHLPNGLAYQTLHDRLKEQGYVIYAGQGQLESKVFRVANMGALSSQDIEGFLAAFQKVVESASVRA
jgi:2-aminoethylphosphonate-pyruvate transaminase